MIRERIEFETFSRRERERPGKNFPVIGNGCSLGGLECVFLKDEEFERFLH